MACAGLLVIMLASTTLQISGSIRGNLGPPLPVTAGKPINLSLPEAMRTSGMPQSGMETSLPQSDAVQVAGARPGISLGPLRAEFGGTAGRHMHLATVKLEGVSVFGGSIGGSIDSRSARITLSWPTGN